MWGYPPPGWGFPPYTGSPQQNGPVEYDAVKMARRWKKFLKKEEKDVKKEEKKEERKHWNAFEIGLMLTVFGPFIGMVYAWGFLTLAAHVADMMHK